MTICPVCQTKTELVYGSIDFHGNGFAWSCPLCHQKIALQLKDLAMQYGATYSQYNTFISSPKGTPALKGAAHLRSLVYPEVLLIQASATDEYADHECHWAVVRITAKLKSYLLSLKTIYEQCKAKQDDLWRMEFFEWAPHFIPVTDELLQFLPSDGSVHRVNSYDWLVREGNLPLHSYLHTNEQRTEASSILITAAGFQWTTTPKHCSFDVETELIEWGALDQFFGE